MCRVGPLLGAPGAAGRAPCLAWHSPCTATWVILINKSALKSKGDHDDPRQQATVTVIASGFELRSLEPPLLVLVGYSRFRLLASQIQELRP